MADNKIYSTSELDFFEKKAKENNSYAQVEFGKIYFYGNGCGVTQDYNKAKEWFEKSANQGNSEAQFYLGVMYYYGNGVTHDYDKAKEWFEKSAKQGDSDAQFNLGMMYYYGYGVTQNYNKAKEWFEKSAKQGNSEAQFYLGVMYYYGYGVTQNYNKAKELFEKLANQGNVNAQNIIGVMYFYGLGIDKANKDTASEYFRKSALQKNVDAICILFSMYLSKNIQIDNNTFEQFIKFAKEENEGALYVLAQLKNMESDFYKKEKVCIDDILENVKSLKYKCIVGIIEKGILCFDDLYTIEKDDVKSHYDEFKTEYISEYITYKNFYSQFFNEENNSFKKFKKDKFIFRGQYFKHGLTPSSLREKSKFGELSSKIKEKFKDKKDNSEGHLYDIDLKNNFDQLYMEYYLLYNFYLKSHERGLDIPYVEEFLNIHRTNQEKLVETFIEIVEKQKENLGKKSMYLPPKNMWSSIALAQHYGLPTRFLDWTYDINVAAYMAISGYLTKEKKENKDKNGEDKIAIWAINESLATKLYEKYIGKDEDENLNGQNLYFVEPPYHENPNLLAQQGVLSIKTLPITKMLSPKKYDNIPLEKEIQDIESKRDEAEKDKNGPLLYKFEIGVGSIEKDYEFLKQLGYTADRLFPGYKGVVQSIFEDNGLKFEQ